MKKISPKVKYSGFPGWHLKSETETAGLDNLDDPHGEDTMRSRKQSSPPPRIQSSPHPQLFARDDVDDCEQNEVMCAKAYQSGLHVQRQLRKQVVDHDLEDRICMSRTWQHSRRSQQISEKVPKCDRR